MRKPAIAARPKPPDVPDRWKRHVKSADRNFVGRQHVEDALARFGRRFQIPIKNAMPFWISFRARIPPDVRRTGVQGSARRADLGLKSTGGMVLPEGIELSTSPLPRECSTTELRQLDAGFWPSEKASAPKKCDARKALFHERPDTATRLDGEQAGKPISARDLTPGFPGTS